MRRAEKWWLLKRDSENAICIRVVQKMVAKQHEGRGRPQQPFSSSAARARGRMDEARLNFSKLPKSALPKKNETDLAEPGAKRKRGG